MEGAGAPAPAAKVDNTQRRKWDVEEFGLRAQQRQRKEEEVGEETARQRRNREKRERDPLHMGLILQRSHLKARDFEVDLTSRLGKTQMIAAGADVSAQVRRARPNAPTAPAPPRATRARADTVRPHALSPPARARGGGRDRADTTAPSASAR